MRTLQKSLALLALVALGATLFARTTPVLAAPTSPSNAYYIDQGWGDPLTWHGHTGYNAYQYGYNAQSGAPIPTVILDFGRQLYEDGIWKNVLFNKAHVSTYCSSCWVHLVAQDFIQGYNDNSAHAVASIAVGTNNGNYALPCGDTLDWSNAGQAWGLLIAGLTGPSKVLVRSGNDIESWHNTPGFGSWVACGAAAETWYDGYDSKTGIPNFDFGSNGNTEYSSLWSPQQVYDVSFGKPTAYAYPQIYCDGQPQSWVGIRQSYSMPFNGITSDNAHSVICNNQTVPTYTWQTAWNTLNTDLVNAGYPGILNDLAASFY